MWVKRSDREYAAPQLHHPSGFLNTLRCICTEGGERQLNLNAADEGDSELQKKKMKKKLSYHFLLAFEVAIPSIFSFPPLKYFLLVSFFQHLSSSFLVLDT